MIRARRLNPQEKDRYKEMQENLASLSAPNYVKVQEGDSHLEART